MDGNVTIPDLPVQLLDHDVAHRTSSKEDRSIVNR
jgi:hypothetical protein